MHSTQNVSLYSKRFIGDLDYEYYLFIVLHNLFIILQGSHSVFSLELQDISESFEIEPKEGAGETSIIIRVNNGSFDYENPNQRKFIILVSFIIR